MLPALGGAAAVTAGALARWDAAWGVSLMIVAALLAVNASRTPKTILAASLAAFLLAFYGFTASKPPDPGPIPFREQMRWRGMISDDPVPTGDGYRMPVALEAMAPAEPEGAWSPVSGTVFLSVEGDFPYPPAAGDLAVFRSSLSPASPRKNPGVLNYELYTARKAIIGRAYATLGTTAVFATPGRGLKPLAAWRSKVSSAISEAWPGPAGAAVKAITLGDRSGIGADVYELFRTSGTVHLLSVSGLHLGILLIISAAAARFILVRIPGVALAHPVDPVAGLAALAPVCLYAYIAGLSVATLRSLLMTLAVVLAGFMGRRTSLGGLLCATAFALILINPLSAADPGFQLSFAAITGLFWLPAVISRRKVETPEAGRGKKGLPGRAGSFLGGLLVASLAATIMTAPIAAFHFGRGGWAGILYNCLCVPVTELVVLPAGLLGAALNPFSTALSSIFFKVAGFSMEMLLAAIKPLPDWEPAFLSAPFSSPLGVAGFFAMIAAFMLKGKKAATRAGVMAAGIFLLLWPYAYGFARGLFYEEVNMWALSVGDGQALIFEMPGGKWVLLDGGGIPGSKADMGKSVTWPALRALGCDKLYMVISSHPHPDHLGGLTYAASEGRPELIAVPEAFAEDPAYESLYSAAAKKGPAIVRVPPDFKKPFTERFGKASLTLYGASGKTPNERCLMAFVRIGRTGIFAPSDVEAPEMARLVEEGFDPGRADVLVAPHHGSADAVHAPFLTRLSPAVTVVSCGDKRGWPSEKLLEVLSAIGSEVFTTSGSGAIHIRADEKGFESHPFMEADGDGRR